MKLLVRLYALACFAALCAVSQASPLLATLLAFRGQAQVGAGTISTANLNLSGGTPTYQSEVEAPMISSQTSAYVSVVSNGGNGTLIACVQDISGKWVQLNNAFITNITTGATGAISASTSGGYVISPIVGAVKIGIMPSSWSAGSLFVTVTPGGSIGAGVSNSSFSLVAPFGQSNMAGSLPVTIAADQSAVGVQTAQPYTLTMANPSVSTATSTTLLAAGTYHLIWIQNNTATNIAISLTGATLTGITPTSSNNCIVVAAGQLMYLPVNAVPTAAITCYQTSGSTTNAITVVSG